jgi:hypothetical protein
VRAFQPELCLRIHFYTGWQFFLFLLCALRFGNDWRGQRCSRFPNPNGNSHIDGSCHGNRHSNCYRNATWHTNGYSYCHRRCVADPYTEGNSI